MITASHIVALIADLDPSDAPAVLAALAAKLAGGKSAPSAPQADELLVDVAEAARMLGKSKSWVYHNHKDLPFTVKGIGSAPRFSKRKLEEYIAKHE